MNTKNKKSNISSMTLTYLIAFSVIILLFLWIVQIGFLKIFYERYRLSIINNMADHIVDFNGDLSNELENIAYGSDACIELHKENEVYKYNILNKDCILNNKSSTILKAKNSLINGKDSRNFIKIESPINNSRSIICGLRLNDGSYIFLNTNLEDVNSTTSILMNQLIYITLVVILLAIIVSYYVSRQLNKPILKITEKAKKMAQGDFSLDEEDYGIEEINELNNVLNYARSEIENTEELRKDLMANVSHDLKTPLTMIKAYAEMARDINCDNREKTEENLSVIISETNRLNVLVNDVLNLSKFQNGKDIMNLHNYDLIESINEILERYKIIEETENYKFILNIPATAIVKADKNKIEQVIYNLLNNAINYTGKDLLVTINVIESKNKYIVEIIDTGKGIEPKDLPLIWNKYYKKEKNHQRNVVGTGLGLSIVKNVLTSHNFDYGVESNKNKGTKFYFEITKEK